MSEWVYIPNNQLTNETKPNYNIITYVFNIPPLLRMFNAIPNDVGPNVAPAAIIALMFPLSTFNINAINIPIPIGKMLPKNAIKKPLVPINFNVDKSISIPASTTSKISLYR